jgi:cysteinyl-tRNA synthetase
LGLNLAEAAAASEKQDAERGDATEIEALVAERSEAKRAKDFARADGIRSRLQEKGILLEDGPGGTVWRRQIQ